jgi:hypothetical protein
MLASKFDDGAPAPVTTAAAAPKEEAGEN